MHGAAEGGAAVHGVAGVRRGSAVFAEYAWRLTKALGALRWAGLLLGGKQESREVVDDKLMASQ